MPSPVAARRASLPPAPGPADERALRERLGVPDDAEWVLVLGETSHWDPNWLHTSEEYYEQRIEQIMDAVVDQLEREPRRVFSIESLFFLRLYWERHPERQQTLARLIDAKRLQLTGTGLTTPDTVLPDTEAIIRDYLYGQQWLREQGMRVEPRVAYLPDDFGHTPFLPTILRALGFDRAAVTRIDGMHFVGCDYRLPRNFPLAGSSAELLLRELRTLDFVWRAPDGFEVLCHWNAFTYFQGDMLAALGIIRWMGKTFGVPWRSARHIARRVRSYVDQLKPVSRTPYLFCPIGCDFNDPIEGLVDLLDRYNQRDYPRTGVWAVNAGLNDYLELVDARREQLPTVDFDPNPYWMGFYASRPEAKIRCNRIARKLVLAEKLSAVTAATEDPATDGPPRPELLVGADLRHAWELLVFSNHHDFITGTSPDRVWHAEQLPLLEHAEDLADHALARVRYCGPSMAVSVEGQAPRWHLERGRLRVTTDHLDLELSEEAGGCIVSCRSVPDGRELLAGPANDLIAYHDTGGLWRMGHEFRGGRFGERERASLRPAAIAAHQRGPLLEVRVSSELCGLELVRWLWFRRESPIVRMRLVGTADRCTTITCRVPTAFAADALTMNVPGGILQRPREKLYRPTFWPARSFAVLEDQASDRALTAFVGGPACVGMVEPGALEFVAFRYAPREMAFGVLPVLAHPIGGTAPDEHGFDYALWFMTGGVRENCVPQKVRRALRAAMFSPPTPELDAVANSVLAVDDEDVLVTALKVACRGEGVIARLSALGPGNTPVRLRCAGQPVRAAWLCDARERDLAPLEIDHGAALLPAVEGITSVRLIF